VLAIALVCAPSVLVGFASSAAAGAGGPGCRPTGSRTVDVSTSVELAAALATARPGDYIRLAAGTYDGRFVLEHPGTATQPITVCGPSSAVLGGGTLQHGYALHLDHADYSTIRGITLRGGLKGIVADHWNHGVIDDVTVTHIGQEGIHLRSFSSYDTIKNSIVSHTGLSTAKNSVRYGEGIYIGSAYENWKTYSDGSPDRSDHDIIEGNSISDTTAESIDVKEGTSHGAIVGNAFDGQHMKSPEGADSWVDVKGNDWHIASNSGIRSPSDGFQVHVKSKGWGRGNIFSGNRMTLDNRGYGVDVFPEATGNTVDCSNVVRGAETALTNEKVRCAGTSTIRHSAATPGTGTPARWAVVPLALLIATAWFALWRRGKRLRRT
jgi:hypothetical protein